MIIIRYIITDAGLLILGCIGCNIDRRHTLLLKDKRFVIIRDGIINALYQEINNP